MRPLLLLLRTLKDNFIVVWMGACVVQYHLPTCLSFQEFHAFVHSGNRLNRAHFCICYYIVLWSYRDWDLDKVTCRVSNEINYTLLIQMKLPQSLEGNLCSSRNRFLAN